MAHGALSQSDNTVDPRAASWPARGSALEMVMVHFLPTRMYRQAGSKTLRFWFLGVVAIMMVGLRATASAQERPTIKIVSSLPRTGRATSQTDAVVNGFHMALEEVSYEVAGFPIVYEDFDDATPARGTWDAAAEASNANQALNDPDVMVYLGPFNSGAASVSIPILNQAELVMISPSTTYPGLTKPGKGAGSEPDVYYPTGVRNYARVVPTDDLQGAVGAAWAQTPRRSPGICPG